LSGGQKFDFVGRGFAPGGGPLALNSGKVRTHPKARHQGKRQADSEGEQLGLDMGA